MRVTVMNPRQTSSGTSGAARPLAPHHSVESHLRLRVRVALATGVTVLTLLGGGLHAQATSAPTTTPTAAALAASNTTATRIAALERTVATTPKNGTAWRDLGGAYVRRAFETADPSYYPLADRALATAATLLPGSTEVLALRAGLDLARHQFRDARALANRVLAARPDGFDARVALIDAQIELGRYSDAATEVDRLLDQRVGVASLSRLSYLRQLQGDIIGAEAAMRQAAIAAPAGSLDRSVAQAYLGDVLMEKGNLDAAARAYDAALAITPTSAVASMGRARVLAARGNYTEAARALDALTQRVPLPGALGLRSEVARAAKDSKANTAADQLVDASIALFQANGAVVDAELAILLADRGPTAGFAAVSAARRAYAERKTMFTADALAWALFVNGDAVHAEPYAREAIATNPAVASVHWHAARVFDALGKRDDASAELRSALRNPWFSISQHANLMAMAEKLGVTS